MFRADTAAPGGPTIKARVSKAEYEALDATLQAEYPKENADGSRDLKVEAVGGLALEDTKGLRASVQAARAERDDAQGQLREAQAKLKGYDEVGLSPEQVAELKDRKPKGGKSDEDVAAVETKWKTKYDADLKAERDARAAEKAQNESDAKEAAVDRALLGANIDADWADLARDAVVRDSVVVVENGKRRVVARDATTGQPRMTERSGQTGHMGLDELVTEVMPKEKRWKVAYRSNGTTGSGASELEGGSPDSADNGARHEPGKNNQQTQDPREMLRNYHRKNLRSKERAGSAT